LIHSTTFNEQRFGKHAARDDIAAALHVYPTHAEIAEFVFVGYIDNPGAVTDAKPPQLVLNIENILECGTFTRTGTMPHADYQRLIFALFHALDAVEKRLSRLNSMGGGAN
jgi:hypothetical protein